VGQDIGKTVADAFLFFLCYSFLREYRLKANGSKSTALPVLDELTVGFLAGSFAKLWTTPLANIVTRKQTSALTSTGEKSDKSGDENIHISSPTTEELAAQIYEEKGVLGFWSGYSASLVLTLNPSITFFLFETFKRLSLPRSKRENPPPAITFLLAAFSKAIASSITYPFSLAKARAQVRSTSPPLADADADSSTTSQRGAKGRPNPLLIFYTISSIATTSGYSGLYSGLPLELTKGFLSHGLTMLLKQHIHTSILQLYTLLSRLLASGTSSASSYLSATKLAADAETTAAEVKKGLLHTTAVATARATAEVEHAGRAAEGVRDWVMESANETAELVKDYVGNGEDDEGEWFETWWHWGHRDGHGEGKG
jgi:hypothetical protein